MGGEENGPKNLHSSGWKSGKRMEKISGGFRGRHQRKAADQKVRKGKGGGKGSALATRRAGKDRTPNTTPTSGEMNGEEELINVADHTTSKEADSRKKGAVYIFADAL